MGLQNHKTFYLKKSQNLDQKLKKSWDIDITKLIHTLWSKVLVPANFISSLCLWVTPTPIPGFHCKRPLTYPWMWNGALKGGCQMRIDLL